MEFENSEGVGSPRIPGSICFRALVLFVSIPVILAVLRRVIQEYGVQCPSFPLTQLLKGSILLDKAKYSSQVPTSNKL